MNLIAVFHFLRSEKGHNQALLKAMITRCKKGISACIHKKTMFTVVGEALEKVPGEVLASEQPDLALKLAPHC